MTDRTETIRASVRDVQYHADHVGRAGRRRSSSSSCAAARATFIPAIALPLSLIGTFGVMQVLGFGLDNLSLMALTVATGFVVDDAIVMIENVVRTSNAASRRWRRRSGAPRRSASPSSR